MIELLTAFAGGLLSFLSPCVLPLAPPYLAYMAGTTMDQITGDDEVDDKVARRVFHSSLFFVLGLGTVFVSLGAGATFLGQLFLTNQLLFSNISGHLIAMLGLHFLGIVQIPLLMREARFDVGSGGGGFGGAYVMGLAFAFGWTPCIGPILASILAIAGQEETIWRGVGMLSVYAAGLGVPFVLAAYYIRPFMAWMKGFRKHMGLVEKAMGALLLIVGVSMATGDFSRAAFWLLETFPILATIG